MKCHVATEGEDSLSWQLELAGLLLPQDFEKLLAVSNQALWAEADAQDVRDVVVLLAVVRAAPVDVGPQGAWRQEDRHTQVSQPLDCLVLVEDLVGELWMEVGPRAGNQVKLVLNYILQTQSQKFLLFKTYQF